jgi:esterase/lipase superfamily enzyme
VIQFRRNCAPKQSGAIERRREFSRIVKQVARMSSFKLCVSGAKEIMMSIVRRNVRRAAQAGAGKFFALGLCLAAAVVMGGCAASSSAITALSDKANAATAAFTRPQGVAQDIPLFVASTRKRNGETITEASFSLQSVSVPPGHQAGAIELPRFGAADPQKHFVVARRRALDPDSFRAEIASHISGRIGNARDVLVYVHGFNTTQEEARYRLAQIVADGGFTGVPVLFTWPSKGELLAYESDKEAATASRDAMVKLLADLSQIPGVGRVHVLAHSMGSWLTMESLRETAISGRRDLDGKLGSVMLAAPDIDLGVFRQQVSKLDASHVSVFVSRDDRALSLSSRIAGDRPRLGAMDPGNPKDAAIIESMGVHVYDLSMLEGKTWIGHDTYANAPDAVRQIGATLTRKREQDAQTQAVIGDAPAQVTNPAPAQARAEPIVGKELPPR